MNRLKVAFRREPFEWSAAALFLVRAAFACVVYFGAIHWHLAPTAAEVNQPNGLAHLFSLGWLANPPLLSWLRLPVALGLLAWVLQWMPAVSLLPALVVAVLTGTLRNSMGDISHHSQLPVMILAAVWAVHVFCAVRTGRWLKSAESAERIAAFAAVIVMAATYFASGVVKLKTTDFQWIQRVPGLAVQIKKSNYSDYYSDLKPVSGFKVETVPQLIIDHPHLARVFFGTGLILELAGLLLVLNPRVALWLGLALIAMHLGITWIMEIDFWNHVWCVLIFCVVPWRGLREISCAGAA